MLPLIAFCLWLTCTLTAAAEPIPLTGLAAKKVSPRLLLSLQGSSEAAYWEPLKRLSHKSSPQALLAAETLVSLRLPDLERRILSELSSGGPYEQRPLINYFQTRICRRAFPLLVARLKNPVERLNALAALRFQSGLDFGYDSRRWAQWYLESRGLTAERKARLLERLGEPTSVLWRAHCQSLDRDHLKRYPRLQAIWPFEGALSADGAYVVSHLSSNNGQFRIGHLPADTETPERWWAASGEPRPCPLDSKLISFASPNGHHRLVALSEQEYVLEDLDSGRRLAIPSGSKVSDVLWHETHLQSVILMENRTYYTFDSSSFRLSGPFPGGLPNFCWERYRGAALQPRSGWLAWSDGRCLSIQEPGTGKELFHRDVSRDWGEAETVDNLACWSRNGQALLLCFNRAARVYSADGRPLASQPIDLKNTNDTSVALSPKGDRVVLLSTNGLRVHDSRRPGRSREREWLAPLPVGTPTFLPDKDDFLAGQGNDRIHLVDAVTLESRQVFWGPSHDFSVTLSGQFSAQANRHFPFFQDEADSLPGPRGTWIWQTEERVPEVPPALQSLLCELWTGVHLRGGVAVPLTPPEYARRVARWKAAGGGDWYSGPRDIREENPLWTYLFCAGCSLALLALAAFRMLIGWCRSFQPSFR